MLNCLRGRNGGGRDHLGLDEGVRYWEPPRFMVVVFRAIACVSVTLLSVSMGRNVRVVDEVNGSPLQELDFSVINQCEVKLTAREAATMTLRVVCQQADRPFESPQSADAGFLEARRA